MSLLVSVSAMGMLVYVFIAVSCKEVLDAIYLALVASQGMGVKGVRGLQYRDVLPIVARH